MLWKVIWWLLAPCRSHVGAPSNLEATTRDLELELHVARLEVGLGLARMATSARRQRSVAPFLMVMWAILSVISVTLGFQASENALPLVIAVTAVMISITVGQDQVDAMTVRNRIEAEEALAARIDRARNAPQVADREEAARLGQLILEHRLGGSAAEVEAFIREVERRGGRLARGVTVLAFLIELIGSALWAFAWLVGGAALMNGRPLSSAVVLAVYAIGLLVSGRAMRLRAGYWRVPDEARDFRAAQRENIAAQARLQSARRSARRRPSSPPGATASGRT